jgi:hypothetical protein
MTRSKKFCIYVGFSEREETNYSTLFQNDPLFVFIQKGNFHSSCMQCATNFLLLYSALKNNNERIGKPSVNHAYRTGRRFWVRNIRRSGHSVVIKLVLNHISNGTYYYRSIDCHRKNKNSII